MSFNCGQDRTDHGSDFFERSIPCLCCDDAISLHRPDMFSGSQLTETKESKSERLMSSTKKKTTSLKAEEKGKHGS